MLFVACTTEKNTFTTRAYHNVTSRYNIYFNAREAYKGGLAKIDKAYKEPFNDILPVFVYKQKSVLQSSTSDMDRALEKCTKLIKNHSITKKPSQKKAATTPKQKEFNNQKEFNKWIDDSYLLMGKAFFYKENYFDAQKNFMFILNEYKNKPIRHDANLWVARTKIEMGQFDDAKEYIDKTIEDKEFPEKLLPEAHALYADIFIQQKRYDEAIANLKLARDETKIKRNKIRYTYILAQLSQEIGDNTKAIAYYKEVEQLNPPYDMAFNAKINQATSFESGSGSSKEVIALLQKLLKDEKNKEYKDQIYFALANVYYAENDEENALKNYKKSVESSSTNPQQKAISFLSIGSIYYNQKKYLESQPYYDSCFTILPKDYRNFSEIKTKTENLNILAKNYNMAVTEDSLQLLAKMPENKRNELIDKKIQSIIAQEQEKQAQDEINNMNSQMYNQEFGSDNQKLSGKWYFYNESVVKFGKSEFIKRWGDRKLEDNWRRNTKTKAMDTDSDSDNPDELVAGAEKTKVEKPSNKTRAYYLENMPTNDSLLTASNKRIEEGMFNVGMAYMNLIQDNKFAIASLEKFIERFPNSASAPIALYYLHILYTSEKNFIQAEKYKSEVIERYPESNYAKALTNPEFYKDLKIRNKQIEKDYAECFRDYVKSDYNSVIQECQRNIQQNSDSYLLPNFSFLLAMSQGKLQGIPVLKTNLQDIITKFPNDQVSVLAKNILDYLAKNETINSTTIINTPEQNTKEATVAQKQKDVEIYTFKEFVPHYYIIAVKSEFVDVKKVKFNLINYNLDYFTNFNFTIDSKELNPIYNYVIVSTLQNNTQAMNYYDLINYNQEIYEGIEKVFTQHFIISEDNYKAMLLDKDIDKYMKFFDEYYSR